MNTNASFQSIADLDLTPIKRKLMHRPSGEGWSQEKADAVETAYRRYLCVMKAYPGQLVSPTVDVDTFWHYHILDTKKYAADCETAFRYFLHHCPDVGLDEADDAPLRTACGERMRTLYETLFGEACPGALAGNPVSAQAWCAGPGQSPLDGVALSWCAGPHESPRAQAAGKAQAWCGGEWPKIDGGEVQAARSQTAAAH